MEVDHITKKSGFLTVAGAMEGLIVGELILARGFE
jgi:hypothetical protein